MDAPQLSIKIQVPDPRGDAYPPQYIPYHQGFLSKQQVMAKASEADTAKHGRILKEPSMWSSMPDLSPGRPLNN